MVEISVFLSKKGFTIVELLVVIAITGILATAVLAALNPIEQIKKGRDTARKADAQAFISAVERFQASFGCYPWAFNAATAACTRTPAAAMAANGSGNGVGVTTSTLGSASYFLELMNKQELKSVFLSRNTIVNRELWVSVNATNSVSVCFEAESIAARGGSMGTPMNWHNEPLGATSRCANAYAGGVTTANGRLCNVCVPQ